MQSVQALQQSGEPIAIYDVPLLYERGMQDMLAGVAVVWVPKATQLERLMARDELSVEAAQSRLDSQLSLDEKKDKATWVIDNSGSLEETARQVSDWLGSIR
jgi:dephospho-CoA kinase